MIEIRTQPSAFEEEQSEHPFLPLCLVEERERERRGPDVAGALHRTAHVEREDERSLAKDVGAGELVLEALPLEQVPHEQQAQGPSAELGELGGEEAGDVPALRDVRDLVGPMLDLLAALAGGDALEATGEQGVRRRRGVVAEPLRKAADGGDRKVSTEASPGPGDVLEVDLAEALHGLHELVNGAGGLLASGCDVAARALLLAWRVRALGQGLELAHEGFDRGRRGGGPALALLREAGERGKLLADAVHLLRPLAEGRFARLRGKEIDLTRVEAIEELVLELLARGIALGGRGEIAGFAVEQEMPAGNIV